MGQVQQLSERREVIDAATAALGGSVRCRGRRVVVLSEAIGRGETTSALARAHVGWIIEWAPSLRAGGAGALLAVTLASAGAARAAA